MYSAKVIPCYVFLKHKRAVRQVFSSRLLSIVTYRNTYSTFHPHEKTGYRKSQGITKVFRRYPLGKIHICSKLQRYISNSCWYDLTGRACNSQSLDLRMINFDFIQCEEYQQFEMNVVRPLHVCVWPTLYAYHTLIALKLCFCLFTWTENLCTCGLDLRGSNKKYIGMRGGLEVLSILCFNSLQFSVKK